MKRIRLTLVLLVAAEIVATSVFAHHGFIVLDDSKAQVVGKVAPMKNQ